MTFAEIADYCRESPRHPSGRLMAGNEFIRKLFAPHRRGWFMACHTWVNGGPSPYDYQKELRALLASFDNFTCIVAKAHLVCARLAHENWTSHTVSMDDLYRVVNATRLKLGLVGLKLGLLQDLVQEFRTSMAKLEMEQTEQQVRYHPWCWDIRSVARDQTLTALLMEELPDRNDRDGVVATLRLELVNGGSGELYPSPSLAFVGRDEDFCKAEENALACVRGLGMWHDSWDARWWLVRREGELPLRLFGNSLGGAFALGLAKLALGE